MRERKNWLVVTFPNTINAMTMERRCGELGLPGRLIPVPREISASCGMAWRAPVEAREALETMTRQQNITPAGWYELLL